MTASEDATSRRDVDALATHTAAAMHALVDASHAEARAALVDWATAAIAAGEPALAAEALTWLGLDTDYTTDLAACLDLVERARRLSADPTSTMLVLAAASRLGAHLPVEPPASIPGLGSGLLTWQANTEPAQGLSSTALSLSADVQVPMAERAARAAWRSTHRAPALLDARTASTAVDELLTIGADVSLDRSICVDLWLWGAVDALEAGDRARYDLLLRRARAQALLRVPTAQAWWVATTAFLSSWLDGDLDQARARMEEAFALGSASEHPGALTIFVTHRWFLDELAGDHAVFAAFAREQAAQMQHALSAVAAGLSEIRGGDVARAEEWARRADRHLLTEHDEETSWLTTLVIGADLATALIRAGSAVGTTLAMRIRPEITRWTERVAVDSRGIGSVGFVARASAELALALGDADACRADLDVAATLLDRLGRPPVFVAEYLLARIRLSVALGEPADDDLATLLSMTASPSMAFLHREGQALAAEVTGRVTSGLDALRAHALDALANAPHRAGRRALVEWAEAAVEDESTSHVSEALAWLALGSDFAVDVSDCLHVLTHARRLPLDPLHDALVTAAAARIVARQPLDDVHSIPGLGPGLLSWHVTIGRAQRLSDVARQVVEGSDEAIADNTVRAAWRSTHRTPALLAERIASTQVGELATANAGVDLDRSTLIDLWLSGSVDALETGDRAHQEVLLRRARAQVALGAPAGQAWWVATTSFLTLWLDGEIDAARASTERSFALGTGIEHPGALAVFVTQRWQVDELAGDHGVYVQVSREQSAMLRHPLSIVAAGLSEVRGGSIERAEEWARRVERLIAEPDEETTWLNFLCLSADLATELARAGSTVGHELAQAVRPHIVRWTDRMSIDGRGVCSAGPVARASADLALVLGDTDACGADLKEAEALLDRLGRPPVNVAEYLLARIRLAIALDLPAADDLATVLALTAPPSMAFLHRQAQSLAGAVARSGQSGLITAHEAAVLDLLVEGLTNPQIADRLGYSMSKISKDVMVITRKLGVATRTEAARAWANNAS